MMKRTTMAAICSVFALIASDAIAQDAEPGWQVGGSVVSSEFERDDGLVDDGSFGFRLHGQYRFNSWLGLEGTYYNSSKFSTDARSPGAEVELVYQGIQLQGIGYIPLPLEDLQLFVKGGYFNFDVSSTIGGSNSGEGTDSGFVIGTGLSLRMSDSLNLRTEFDWYDTDRAELWTIGLGLEYHF